MKDSKSFGLLNAPDKGKKALLLCALMVVVFIWSPGFVQAGNFQDQTAKLMPGYNDQWAKVAWGDYNNDGYVDIMTRGALWRNNAGTGFTEIAIKGSPGPGLWADFDNDGRLDYYDYGYRGGSINYEPNGKSGANVMYRNTSTSTTTSFQPVPMPSRPMGKSSGASFADFDNNGFIDLYVGGYEGGVNTDAVLFNNKGVFTSSSKDHYNKSPARGVTTCDFDRDGDQDVYVSNYRLVANRLLQNDGKGNLKDVGVSKGVAGDGGSGAWGHTIGSAWGDFDNDGYMDLFVGNFSHPASYQDRAQFLRNPGAGGGKFQLKNTLDGDDWQESYASPSLGDYDNDGDLDLFFTTVYGGNNPRLYRNDGNWTFTNVTAEEGLANLSQTYTAAWADFDNDGDLDLITAGKIFVNNESDTGSNHWLKVHLTGDGTTVNSAAIGSQVRITVNGKTMTRQVEGGTGEGNQNDLTLHFGLGNYSGLLDLEITSPTGAVRKIKGVSVDQTVKYVVTGTPVAPAGAKNIDKAPTASPAN